MESKSLEKHLLTIAKILREFQSKSIIGSYAVVGGVAVSAIAIPRATKDVDFLVTTNDIDKFYMEFENAFKKKGYLLEYKRPEEKVFPYHSIIFYLKQKTEELRIADVLISTRNWQDEISQYTVSINYEGESIPFVNTEGLIILKLKAGGPMDIIDVENILKVIDVRKLDKKLLFNWAKRAGVDKLLNKILKVKK